MGCVASKKALAVSPAYEASSSYNASGSASAAAASSSAEMVLAPGSSSMWSRPARVDAYESGGDGGRGGGGRCESGGSSAGKGSSSSRTNSTGSRLGNLHRYIEGEQAAAGWPAWLSAVACEAVHGWVPLKAESFEKLEKIGQGTYSSVFRALNLETGRMVALKKVRFDSVEPESVRFMAREIMILRRLQQHPNVVRLEGLITSRLSCNIYLVFEYMDHDLAGLTACSDVAFSESQIKCYMQQLLSGLEHCHARGVIHRDIKCANLLVGDDGVLKVADFGLANFFSPAHRLPLTSRVVTLWYRPPELLLGATSYDSSVDLWSAGCVFAELFTRKPILQGRTEVEQIHKIFKLCGSPPDDYWRRSKMSHAAVFRPQQPYESRLKDTFRSLPETAFRLLGTLLSVEPSNRGTAASALVSEYFKTKPYACDPSSLPEYAPSKEMDAKFREDSRRRINSRNTSLEAAKRLSRAHKSLQEPNGANQRHVHAEESLLQDDDNNSSVLTKDQPRPTGEPRLLVELQPVPAINKRHDGGGAAPYAKQISMQADLPFSGPAQLSASTGFAWAKKPKPASKPAARRCARGPRTAGADELARSTTRPYDVEKQEMIRQWTQASEVFDTCEAYKHRPKPVDHVTTVKDDKVTKRDSKGERVEFSGPLLSQSRRVDELLQNHERQIRQAVRRSWFHKGGSKRRR